MDAWLIWLIVAVVFVVIEALSVELVSIWFAVSALVSMVLALCKVHYGWQLGIFAVLSLILVLVTRPIFSRYLKRNTSKTNVDSMIGNTCTVLKTIKPDDRGEVLYNHQEWLAISNDNSLIEENEKVKIIAIEGAKLIVKKIDKSIE